MTQPLPPTADSPCQRCGACCASFRVSFYWGEAVERGLPEAVQEQLTPWHACMRGTNAAQPHCVALRGEVGREVSCSVYAARPSPCREVQPGDARCRDARARHGLAALASQ
jgi:hypothetical protein